ncbi:MAG TPA: lipoprotein signal peptidase, partial [Bacteroidia bacterium]|nr:lipoprotein signal peptidase [Bacteroidia bacterium]
TGSWFYLHFVENPGMAFGLQLGDGAGGKLLLSLFRLVAVGGIGYYLWKKTKENVRPLLIVCVALIFAGALGNILDSVFYGKFFGASDPWDQNIAQFMPASGGYAGFLHGQVVDMFYFPVLRGHFPQWFPLWGGEDYLFFRPVFNIADASISVGVFLLIVFQARLFSKADRPVGEKRILLTNIFFSFLAFLISSFLLFTYMTLASKTHPLSGGRIALVFGLAAVAGAGMFLFLKNYPVYVPPAPPAPATEAKESADHTSADSAPEENS